MHSNSYILMYCNKMFRILVFILLTWSVSNAYAGPGDAETTLTGEVKITGGYVVNTNHTISGTGTSVTITGDLTVNKELKIKNNSLLIVKGDLILNDDAKLKINEGGDAGEGATVVVQGNLIINGISHPTEVFANNKAILIVKGNLNLNGTNTENKIKAEKAASITIMGKVSGTGKIELMGNQNQKGYISILGGFESEQENNITIKIDHIKQVVNDDNEDNLLYISGAGAMNIDGYNVNISNQESTAYTASINNIATANAAGLLPIELTSFTATATESGYTFNWVTASEKENDYFTLEYSINGVDFSEIDYVHGAGTTSETSEYEYRWNDAPNFEMIYFRLKQTDYNGEYTYSDVIVSCRRKSAGATRTFRYGPLNLQVVDGELRYIENK